jgi:nitroreductase
MDVRLAVASKRDHREFDPRPVPAPLVTRILDAGRLAGSARNRQPWRFFLADDPTGRAVLAPCVYVPGMIAAAPVAIAIAVESAGSAMSGFDAGRAAQNMMLAAWEEGVASCPNGIADPARAAEALRLGPTELAVTVLALGYPAHPKDPARRGPEEWSRRARRSALDDLVVRLP